MGILSSDGNLDGLRKLFAEDLKFKGLLFRFELAAAYLRHL